MGAARGEAKQAADIAANLMAPLDVWGNPLTMGEEDIKDLEAAWAELLFGAPMTPAVGTGGSRRPAAQT